MTRRALVYLLLPFALAAQDQPLAVTGATLVNPGRPPVTDAVVVLQGGRVVAAGPAARVKVPPGADILDARGKWIIPGLVDAHVHFFQSGGVYTRPDAFDLRAIRSYEAEQAEIRRRLPDALARYLRCGITTVYDMGGPDWNFELRATANRSERAPRVWLSGPLITAGPVTNREGRPVVNFLSTGPDPSVRPANTEAEARAEVRRQAALGTDFIKVWVWRGAATPVGRAIIDEAHGKGLKVAVHATELAGARSAVEAGIDILVHSIEDQELPDDLLALMKRRGVTLIPTLAVYRGYVQMRSRRFAWDPWEYELADPHVMGTFFDPMHLDLPLTEPQRRLIQEAKPWSPNPVTLRNLRKLVDAGVNVAAGTDAGNPGTFHGPALFTEFKVMLQAGLTPAEILASATLAAARALGQERDFGSLETGKRADLVLLDADPLADILNVRRIHRVLKAGRIHDPAALLAPSPEDVVQRQLVAYNARDVAAFAATYAEDVAIVRLPEGSPGAFNGQERLKQVYGKAFQERADLGVKIEKRIVQGPFVVDQETFVHRWDPAQRRPAATAVYQVENGLIRRVWFLNDPPKP